MPISHYVRPQTEIYQQLEITVDEVGSSMSACVLGPNYALYRYGKEELAAHVFTQTSQSIPFVFAQEYGYDYAVDQKSVRIFAEGMQAKLAEFSEKVYVDEKNPMVLRIKDSSNGGSAYFANTTGAVASELKNYGVQIGDLVRIETEDSTEEDEEGKTPPRTRTIVDIVGKVIPSVVTCETLTTQENNGSAPRIELDPKASDNGGNHTYTGPKNTVYLITMLEETMLQITDTSGLEVAQFLTLERTSASSIKIKNGASTTSASSGTLEFNVGTYGVKAKITNATKLHKGDQFSITCVAATESSTEFDGILLDGMPVDAKWLKENSTNSEGKDRKLKKVVLLKQFDGELVDCEGVSNPFTTDEEKVTIKENLAWWIDDQKSFAPFEDKIGKLYVQFRVLIIPEPEEEKFLLTSVADIQKYFGTIDQDNDLAYGCYAALEGAAYRAIYAMRTRGTTADDFLEAVYKTKTDPDLYSYAVITEDANVAKAVADYNVTLCAPDVKMFRRTFWGIEAPGEYSLANVDDTGKELRATFGSLTGDSNDTNNVLVSIADDNMIDLKNISFNGLITRMRAGDKVQLLTNGAVYTVQKVLSSKELVLESGPKTEIDAPKAINLIHANTPVNRREFVQGTCGLFNSLRKTVVWTDNGTKDMVRIHNKYLGAYVAGLASAIVPQQSMTHSEVTLIDNASRTYTQYTREELDEIAKYGCLVIAQDTKGGPCYVRHNLTTETDKGLLYYEESCIRNVDNMSFKVESHIARYIGKSHVTPSALLAIYRDLYALFDSFTKNGTDELIGPQLVSFSDLTVEQDQTLKSRVIVRVRWDVPVPLNNIQVFEMVFAASVAAVSSDSESK